MKGARTYLPVLLLTVVSVALAFAWPAEGVLGFRFWSLTPLRTLPLPVAAIFVLLALAVGVLPTARRTRPEGHDLPVRGWRARLPKMDDRKAIRVLALTTALGLVTAFTVRYGLLGDNWLRVSETLAGSGNANERGALAFYSTLVRVFGNGTLEDAAEVIRNVGRVCGIVYAALWVGLSARPGLSPEERRAVITLALFSGGFLLFCGYLEIYAPLVVLLLILALVTVKAVDHPAAAFLPLLVALGAAGYHLVALLWLPMATVPLLARVIGRKRKRVLGATGFAIVCGLGLALLLSRESSLFLRLTPRPERPYALLSLSHLSDYLNAQWIGSVAGVLLGWGGAIAALRRPYISTVAWLAVWGWLLPGIGLFLFNPVLGAADWDVLSLAAPFGLLVALTAWPGAEDGSEDGDQANPGGTHPPRSLLRSRLFPIAVALNVTVTPAWLVLHRSGASAAWVGELLRNDRGDYYQTHPADLHLAFLYGSNGLDEERRRALTAGRAAHPDDPRFPLGLARDAAAAGNWAQAQALAMTAYGIVRGYLPALDVLYDVFRATGRAEDQIGVGTLLLEAAATDPANVSPFLSRERLEEIERDLDALPKQ